jgi:hypothetical protein
VVDVSEAACQQSPLRFGGGEFDGGDERLSCLLALTELAQRVGAGGVPQM